MKNLLLLCFYLTLFFVVPAQGTTNIGGVLLDAKVMERDLDKKVTILEGQVQVIFNQQILNCDRAEIYWEKDLIIAKGRLTIQTPTAYIEGDRAELNTKTNKGKIINGYVRSGQVVLEGKVIEKLNDKEFIADDAYYTACTTCPPSWSFTGSKIKAEIGGYAYIDNSILRIVDVPVFWLPYIVVPLKSKRQTGLLVPAWNYSEEDGASFTIPFFWAINRSQDATLSARYYTRRGEFFKSEYRYVLSQESEGAFNFGLLRDRVFKEEPRLQGKVDGDYYRWFGSYKHYFKLPNGYVSRAKINTSSDIMYANDFPEDFPLEGEPALENRTSLAKNFEKVHLSADITYNINQLKENPLANNEDAVHRFPELKFQIRETPVFSDLYFSMDLQYVHFARDGYAYDDVTLPNDVVGDDCQDVDIKCHVADEDRDGVFNANKDLIRTGERMDVRPSLTYPILVGKYLNLTPKVSYRYTKYAFTVDPQDQAFDTNPVRQYFQTQLKASTSLARIYQGSDVKRQEAYKHEIVANVQGSIIPYFEQTNSAFFGDSSNYPANKLLEPISDVDFVGERGIQFDDVDRITDRQLVTFTLDNYVTRKLVDKKNVDYKRIALFRLSQSYDFNEAKRSGNNQPWSAISGLVDLRFKYFNTNTSVDYFPYLDIANTATRMQFNTPGGNYFTLGYSQSYIIPEDPSTFIEDDRIETLALGGGLRWKYFNISGSLQQSLVSFKINRWNLYFDLIPPGNCWGVKLWIQTTTNNSPDWRFSFDYNFGGT